MTASLRQVGPLLRDRPTVRAVMACEVCGQGCLCDCIESAGRDDDADGTVINAAPPEAVAEAGFGAPGARAGAARHPRLVVEAYSARHVERVA